LILLYTLVVHSLRKENKMALFLIPVANYVGGIAFSFMAGAVIFGGGDSADRLDTVAVGVVQEVNNTWGKGGNIIIKDDVHTITCLTDGNPWDIGVQVGERMKCKGHVTEMKGYKLTVKHDNMRQQDGKGLTEQTIRFYKKEFK
jgi:hypothetical protein